MYAITRHRHNEGLLIGFCADLWVYQISGRVDTNIRIWRDGIAFFEYPQEVIEVLNEYLEKLKEARKLAEKTMCAHAQGD